MLHENTNYIPKLGSNFFGYRDSSRKLDQEGGGKSGFPKIEGRRHLVSGKVKCEIWGL